MGFYFASFSVVNRIDLFIRNEYKDIMIDSWKHCQQYKGLEIYGWCIMSSHIHMIIGTHGENLENIMRDMKKHTSIALKKAIMEHPSERMDALDDDKGREEEQPVQGIPALATG